MPSVYGCADHAAELRAKHGEGRYIGESDGFCALCPEGMPPRATYEFPATEAPIAPPVEIPPPAPVAAPPAPEASPPAVWDESPVAPTRRKFLVRFKNP